MYARIIFGKFTRNTHVETLIDLSNLHRDTIPEET